MYHIAPPSATAPSVAAPSATATSKPIAANGGAQGCRGCSVAGTLPIQQNRRQRWRTGARLWHPVGVQVVVVLQHFRGFGGDTSPPATLCAAVGGKNTTNCGLDSHRFSGEAEVLLFPKNVLHSQRHRPV